MRFYRLLLRAYPRSFRRRFGDAMEQAWAERVRAAASRGPRSVAACVVRSVVDVFLNATLVHAAQIRDRFLWPEPSGSIHGPRGRSPNVVAVAHVRCALRLAHLRPQSGLYAAGGCRPDARHWRQHGDLHDRPRSALETAPLQRSGPAGDAVEHQRDGASRSRHRRAA